MIYFLSAPSYCEVLRTGIVSYFWFPWSSVGKEFACNAGDPGSLPVSERPAGEGIGYPLQYSWASLVAQLVKNPPAMQKTWVRSWVGKIPWRRERLPFPVFWPGEFHGRPWGHKESDRVTKSQTRMSDFHFHFVSKGPSKASCTANKDLLHWILRGPLAWHWSWCLWPANSPL